MKLKPGTFAQSNNNVERTRHIPFGHLFEERSNSVQVHVFKVHVIFEALQSKHVEEAKRVHPCLCRLWFSDVCPCEVNSDVDLLISTGFIREFTDGEVVSGREMGLLAISTSLGWVLSSPIKIPH